MFLDVIKFTERRGIYGVTLDDYRVLPEDDNKRKEIFQSLKSMNAFDLQIINVEVMPCHVDLNESVLKFPKTGRRAHITELLFEDNTSYLEIYSVKDVTYKELGV